METFSKFIMKDVSEMAIRDLEIRPLFYGRSLKSALNILYDDMITCSNSKVSPTEQQISDLIRPGYSYYVSCARSMESLYIQRQILSRDFPTVFEFSLDKIDRYSHYIHGPIDYEALTKDALPHSESDEMEERFLFNKKQVRLETFFPSAIYILDHTHSITINEFKETISEYYDYLAKEFLSECKYTVYIFVNELDFNARNLNKAYQLW